MASLPARGLPARALLRGIDAYQHLFRDRPSLCRYVPSCSQYAREAVESHGAGRGSWLAARRLCRCHPWGGHGYDPVPGRERAPEREGASC
jgi:putative membrane protein insertion efficiency factor